MRHLIWGLALAGALTAAAPPAAAQGLFEPVASVNGTAITRFQVEERQRFLQLLGAPGSDFAGARDALVDEAIQARAALAAGVEVSPEDLQGGIAEFAGRANLSADEFTAALVQAGIAPETLRDFVRNGLLWRGLVQRRFGALARPDEAELARRLARGDARAGVEVLLSEIAIPVGPEDRDAVLAFARDLSGRLSGEAAFAAAARQASRSPTAPDGGRLDPIRLSELSPAVAQEVLALPVGGVTEPVDFGSFVALFLLRGVREGLPPPPDGLRVDLAEVRIPGGRSEAALAQAGALRARADRCDDLYGLVAPERVARQQVAVDALPPDLRQEVAKLDPGEVSTLLADGDALRFVMLCDRIADAPAEAREALGQSLLNARLQGYADTLLDELRADARVERP